MEVAVTGGTGFLGRHVVEALASREHRVRILSRQPGAGSATRIRGDLSDRGAVRRLLDGADALFHLAVRRTTDWHRALADNVALAAPLLEQAADSGCERVVVVGSSDEYAGHGALPDAPLACLDPLPLCAEDAPLGVHGLYGLTKRCLHLVATALARERGLPLWYLRLPHLYGPGDESGHILPVALRALRAGTPLETTGGEQIRDWLHVRDAADVLARCLDVAPPGGRCVLNVGTSRAIALRDLLRSLCRAAGREGLLELGARPYRARGEAHVLVLDARKCGEVLGWSPFFPDPPSTRAEWESALQVSFDD